MSENISKTILIVEDEAIISLIITKTVRRFGYNALSVNSGEKSIELIKSTPDIDLILMDIELGSGMDGTIAAQRILEIRDIPIIFHTSHSEREMVERVRGITRYGYVIKSSGDFVLQSSIEMAFELVEANKKVKESEEYFYELFDLAPLGYQSLDEHGVLIEVNKRWLETFGYTKDEVIGRWFGDFLSEEFLESFREKFPLFKEAGTIHSEFQMVHKNGEKRFIAFDGRIAYGDEGDFRQIHCILSDITDRKTAEAGKDKAVAALRESERFIMTVMDNLPIGVAVNSVNPEVRFDYMNSNFVKNYRTTFEALSSPDGFWDVVIEDKIFREEIKKRVLEDCASGDPERMFWGKVPIARNGKETTYINAMNVPLDEDNLMISLVWDVTADKKAEETIKAKNDELIWLNEELHSTVEELESVIEDLEASNNQLSIVNKRLADSEEKFRQMFLQHHAVMMLVEPESGIIIDANLSAEKFYGYTSEQFKSMYIQEINMLPADEVAAERERAREDRRNYFIFRHRLANSEIRTVEVYSSPVMMEGNTFLFSIIHDITPRIEAEEKLKFSEERYSTAIAAVDDGIWEWNVASGDAFFNTRYYTMLGYSDGEFSATYNTWRELVHPEDIDRVEHDLVYSVKNGIRFNIDLRMRKKEGEWLWVCTRGKSVEKNAEGVTVRMVGTLSDVTNRKFAELELVRSQESLERVIENSSELICEIDRKGRYTFVSGRYKDVLGYTPEELLGQSTVEKMHPDDLPAARKRFKALKSGAGKSIEILRFMHKKGNYRFFECRSSTYVDRDGFLKIVVVSHDITESKYMEDTQIFLALGGTLFFEDDFFKSLARFLSRILGMEYICIDRFIHGNILAETLVFLADGVFRENMEYELKGTPCGEIIGKPSCVFPRNVREFFPDDVILRELNAESYIGVTLWDSEGKPVGIIAAVSRREIDDIHQAESILKMTGFRAAAEIERRDAEERIKRLLKEKEILLKEVHHRIKNNMNSVKGLLILQADSAIETATQNALKDAVNRLDSMMVLYDRLYRTENVKEVSIGDYLPSLINQIISNCHNSGKVKCDIRIEDFVVNVKILVPLGVIVNEVITNIMKYAFSGRESGLIKVTGYLEGREAVLTIEDNGVGLPEGFNMKQSPGFGMQLILMLTDQIGGELKFENGNGTRFTLKFLL